jgi:hypothetical protein
MESEENMNNRIYKCLLIPLHEASCYPRKPKVAIEAEADDCSGIFSAREHIP